MNILLSAFACHPSRGSETGVGWNWSLALASEGHTVITLTQERNRVDIETFLRDAHVKNLRFEYVDFGGTKAIPGGTIGHYIYYYIWQIAALIYLCKSGIWRKCDVVHHLTYGGIKTGSLLFLLPKPFIFGPVGGGERAPLRLAWAMGVLPYANEVIRTLFILLAFIDPVFVMMQFKAVKIFVRTNESLHTIWRPFRKKTSVQMEIGTAGASHEQTDRQGSDHVNVLFAGRLLYWKGCEIFVDVAGLLKERSFIKWRVAGKGPLETKLRDKVAANGAEVQFLGHLTREEMNHEYLNSDIFLFPSLHDSGGTVVLEAISFGKPVICLNLGGPPIAVGDSGMILDVDNLSYKELCVAVADAVFLLASDRAHRRSISLLALERSRRLTWRHHARATYKAVEIELEGKIAFRKARSPN